MLLSGKFVVFPLIYEQDCSNKYIFTNFQMGLYKTPFALQHLACIVPQALSADLTN